eukprot:scaffold122034_cov32-Tisochrysis_lutea.AAC.6
MSWIADHRYRLPSAHTPLGAGKDAKITRDSLLPTGSHHQPCCGELGALPRLASPTVGTFTGHQASCCATGFW